MEGGRRVRHFQRVGMASVALLLAFAAGAAIGSQKPGKVPLQSEKVLLENDKVRVLEYRSKPSGGVCGVDRHSHPPHVTIVMDNARDRLIPEGGKPEEADLKAGDVSWSEGETHTDLNIGTTESRLIIVEIK